MDNDYRKQMFENLNTWSKEIIDGYKEDEEKTSNFIEELEGKYKASCGRCDMEEKNNG
jgi:hypothetical protein